MQVKKEDLRESILETAEIEFLKKGFKAASMRKIAQKSHTTLGNIYNYFKSKEELLDAVVGDIPSQVENLLRGHKTHPVDITDANAVNRALDEMNPRELGIDIFLNPKFVILMEGCKDTKYHKYKEEMLLLGKIHVLEHLKNAEQYEKFVEILVMTFFNGILFIAKSSGNMEEARSNFIRLYKLVCSGFIKECEIGEKYHD